ncbi:MAG TPA: TIR domain-containing protein [Thermoanaerobaculia bacterium]
MPPTVFVSYSHRDDTWKGRLLPQLRVLVQLGLIDLWEDKRIDAGDAWYPEIRAALEKAAAAVCLISANYLSSDFVSKEEVPYFLAQREQRGLLLLPVLVSECPWRLVDWIKATQLVPAGARPLDSLPDSEQNIVLSALAELIAAKLGKGAAQPGSGQGTATAGRRTVGTRSGTGQDVLESIERGQSLVIPITLLGTGGAALATPTSQAAPPTPEAVDISRLPVTGAELFGRSEELRWLDELWESPSFRVVSLVAWGGVGKSTLVNKWLERMERDGYRGARKVFAWSFFSQGTSERVTSADLFVDQALRFFGDPAPIEGSPWSKGERLAALVRGARNLLILDGLEPLQSPTDGWRVQDPGLGQLLRRLARPARGGEGGSAEEVGLCVITSRQRVADLDGFPATTTARDLEQISPEAGRALLRVRGVRGTDAELEDVARAFGCQALAVNLVASFLQGVPGRPASAAGEIPDLDVPVERGRHPRRVLEAFARRFGSPGPEVELLLLLGLFDRPALPGALAALRAVPAIPGLTERLAGLSEAAWERLLRRLRTEKLIAEEDKHQPELVDAHPLVREHFGERLEQENPEAWLEGHWRLSEFYSGSAEPRPDTPDGLAPLFAAVYHGCKAGRHEAVYDDVYWQRIQHREFFAVRQLGLFSATLQALAGFFRVRWTQPVEGLPRKILSHAGGFLQAVGQLREAAKAREACLESDRSRNDNRGAANEARSLSLLHLALGDITKALPAAELSVKLAGQNDEVLWPSLAVLGTVLHYSGSPDQAEDQFRLAERSLVKCEPDSPTLYTLAGFLQCDLLLDQGAWEEVQERAERGLVIAEGNHFIRDIALGHLYFGRAYLLGAKANGNLDSEQAREHLGLAVDGLRQAGELDYLPRGLLARADLRRSTGDFRGAEDDLEESLYICTRCELRLLEADTHLGYARFHLAQANPTAARYSLTRVRVLIEQAGYHRRDRDLSELQGALTT